MKKFEAPEMQVYEFPVEDILSGSSIALTEDQFPVTPVDQT